MSSKLLMANGIRVWENERVLQFRKFSVETEKKLSYTPF